MWHRKNASTYLMEQFFDFLVKISISSFRRTIPCSSCTGKTCLRTAQRNDSRTKVSPFRRRVLRGRSHLVRAACGKVCLPSPLRSMETLGRCERRVFDSAHVRGKRQASVFTQQATFSACCTLVATSLEASAMMDSCLPVLSLVHPCVAPIGRCDLQNLREGRQRVTRDRDPEFIVATANGITEALQRFHRHQGYAGIRFVPQSARTSSACQPLNSLLERKAS